MLIDLIVAMSSNRVIGVAGDLPWSLPDELAYFKKLTQGKTVIMGRKTFESLGCRPLKNRLNIVVSRQAHYDCPDCILANSLPEALRVAKESQQDEVFVIGGAQLYQEAVGVASRLYVTVVNCHIEGDAFFPYDLKALLSMGWRVNDVLQHSVDERHAFEFACYQLVRG